jgi:hypothetical protein
MGNAHRLADLRKRLASTQMAARNAREDLAIERAQAEAEAIEAAGGDKALGANAEARERALTIALSLHQVYQSRLMAARALDEAAASIEAELEGEKDLRRQEEWAVRARLAAALDGRGVQSERGENELGDDDGFEQAADAQLADVATREVREQVAAGQRVVEGDPFDAPELDPDSMPF